MNFSFSTKPKNSGDDCCTPQPKSKAKCPLCEAESKGILSKTLNALLKSKEKFDSLEGFYLCKTSTCKAVYFKENKVLTQEDVSVSVGFKADAKVKNYCYCFGWTQERILEDIKEHGKSRAIDDIKDKMDSIGCSCEVKNPSGKCCMSDVKKVVATLL